ncbi:hypothetical protein [Schnuerera sp.]|uniref:hypothetical protein n=1 Tax=Schnuerera sp. TaxID=2794844 RepID=UPI002BE6CEE3|nr:hypothetical protein [Schnuerera sp.]HSH35131.1 hypothetical protein [Schnuerera sp.]
MKTIFKYFEKTLILLSILSLLLLLATQYLSYNEDSSILTTIGGKDGRNFIFSDSLETNEKGIIILKNMKPKYKDIEVLVNGEYINDFKENDELKIYVYNNDMVEIDGTKYKNQLIFKIVGVSNNIEMPKLDTIITTSQNIEILSKVQLK